MDSNVENSLLLFPSDLATSENSYQIYINSPLLNPDTETNYISTSKYQWSNFFPKMIMEQFAKMANVYFLIVAILQSVKSISFTDGSPLILLPLGLVVIVNGLKDLFEDLKRKKSDNEENNRLCYVFDQSTNSFTQKKWRDIVLGDIVKVFNGELFPTDLILLNSSEPSGICYVETKNIDGETNLKYKQPNKTIKDLCTNEQCFKAFQYLCVTKQPNEFIYQFDATLYHSTNGRIRNANNYILIDKNSFLLRGCSLRQTEYIYGAVVYVGHNTKSMINSPNAVTKTSSLDKAMSIQIIVSFLILIGISLIASIIHISIYSYQYEPLRGYLYYGEHKREPMAKTFFVNGGIWLLMLSNFVPISLLVTLEFAKFFQGIMIMWDIKLYDKERFLGASVQTSTLNEELGQVQYVFSDKTGTLTKNYMQFRMMSIGDKLYGDYDEIEANCNRVNGNRHKGALKDEYGLITNVNYEDKGNAFDIDCNANGNDDRTHQENLVTFMICLSLCNTVITDVKLFNTKSILNYQASSPDEKALIYFARSKGFVFLNRSIDNEIQMKLPNNTIIKYKVLHILEYTSERKRMSIIVRCPDNKLRLYSKGADSIISQLITQNKSQLQMTNNHLTIMAVKGLRTLMIAYKELTEEEYKDYDEKYNEIALDVNRKDTDITSLYDSIENNLYLLGATGIEDQLQDNVSDIISSFIDIGIKVWMLTGDKMDTAKNIAYSCKLFNSKLLVIEIREDWDLNKAKSKLKDKLNRMSSSLQYGLIVSSDQLTNIFTDKELLDIFTQICIKCTSVVCSRVSPKQKAEMVSLVKTNQSAITLAIGDGANDVGMITEANIGIGLHGVEGTQAARASDYSITQFGHLKRLLFYHGRESYRKNAYLVCYNFYKNVLFVIIQFWAGTSNIYSGQNIFDPWIYQLFNAVFTAFPIGWFAVLDLEYSPDTLMQNGRLYLPGMYHKLFHYKRFWKWVAYGVIHGLCLYLFCMHGMNVISSNGKDQDMWSIGTTIYGGVVLLANINVMVNTSTHTVLSALIPLLSILSFYVVVMIQSNMAIFKNLDNMHIVLGDAKYYLIMLEVVGMITLIEVFIRKIAILSDIVKDVTNIPALIEMNRNMIDLEDKPYGKLY